MAAISLPQVLVLGYDLGGLRADSDSKAWGKESIEYLSLIHVLQEKATTQ